MKVIVVVLLVMLCSITNAQDGEIQNAAVPIPMIKSATGTDLNPVFYALINGATIGVYFNSLQQFAFTINGASPVVYDTDGITLKLNSIAHESMTVNASGANDVDLTIDFDVGQHQKLNMVNGTEIDSFSSRGAGYYSLQIVQDATGGHGLTLPSNLKLPSGVTPNFATAANAVNILNLFYDGSSWHGQGALEFQTP